MEINENNLVLKLYPNEQLVFAVTVNTEKLQDTIIKDNRGNFDIFINDNFKDNISNDDYKKAKELLAEVIKILTEPYIENIANNLKIKEEML